MLAVRAGGGEPDGSVHAGHLQGIAPNVDDFAVDDCSVEFGAEEVLFFGIIAAKDGDDFGVVARRNLGVFGDILVDGGFGDDNYAGAAEVLNLGEADDDLEGDTDRHEGGDGDNSDDASFFHEW